MLTHLTCSDLQQVDLEGLGVYFQPHCRHSAVPATPRLSRTPRSRAPMDARAMAEEEEQNFWNFHEGQSFSIGIGDNVTNVIPRVRISPPTHTIRTRLANTNT